MKGYKAVSDDKLLTGGPESRALLQVIQQTIKGKAYLQQLSAHWSQESNKTGSLDMRSENAVFIKYLGNFPSTWK